MVAAQHVQHHEVIEAVAVDVGEIDAHREEAALAHGQPRERLKMAATLVDPNPVHGIEIVANVEVGKTVAVQVAEHHRQSPVIGRRGQGPPVLIQEGAAGEGDRNEVGAALIAVEHVHLALFIDAAARVDGKSVGQIGVRHGPAIDALDHLPAVDHAERELRVGHVHQSARAIIRDIKVQITVAIEVAQRQRHSAFARIEDGKIPGFGEAAFAVVNENVRAAAEGIDDEVQIAVAIQIDQRGAGGRQIRTGHACRLSNVLKFPMAQVAVEAVPTVEAAKIQVAPTIPVDVPRRDARAVEQDLIGEMPLRGELISEENPGAVRRQQRESGFSVLRDGEFGAPIMRPRLPVVLIRRGDALGQASEQGQTGQAEHSTKAGSDR